MSTGVSSPAEGTLSREALAFVQSVGAATDLPAFVQNVRAIATVASDLEARVALLEQAIVRDVALTTKVLRIASSALNGGGTPITSVKQAIMLLGYDRVQHLSASASMFEQIEKNAPAVQDLLVLSVLTANQSLSLAIGAGYGRPEMAYLCGLFRNLGEVLVACYRATQYREWTDIVVTGGAQGVGSEEKHFGFTFDQVGLVLAQRWGMPADLVQTLRRIDPSDDTARDRLHHITQCSADLTRLTYGALQSDGALPDSAPLIESYTKALGVEAKVIHESVATARMEATPTLDTMHVSVDGWLAAREERYASKRLELELATSGESAVSNLTQPNESDSASEAEVRGVVRSLSEQRQQGDRFTVGAATAATLDAARGAGFRRSLLALSTEDFSVVKGRMGAGVGHEELLRTFAVRPQRAFGPLGEALQLREDVFIDTEVGDGKSFRRDRMLRELRPRCVALLPLVLEDKLIGCLYFDNGPDPVECSDTIKELLRAMRDHLVAAFSRHRQASAAAAAA